MNLLVNKIVNKLRKKKLTISVVEFLKFIVWV